MRSRPGDGYLLSLEEQAERLTDVNAAHWGGLIEVDSVDLVATHHRQSLDDLELLYVDFGSPKETLDNWWKVIAASQPRSYRFEHFNSEAGYLRIAEATRNYSRGIHRVRLNLLAYWRRPRSATVLDIRREATSEGVLLAHGEALAALALQPNLVAAMDGKTMPFIEVAGYECTVPVTNPWAHVPYVYWMPAQHLVCLGTDWIFDKHPWRPMCAMPTVVD
jgi:hypothetical protein